MNRTLLDSINSLREDLLAEKDSLLNRLHDIEAELMKLLKAETVAKSNPSPPPAKPTQQRRPAQTIKPKTIMADVMHILEARPEGLIALDILRELNKERERPLMRTSLSPQLSRLKQGGFVRLDGSNWKVANPLWREAYEIEAPPALARGAS